MEIKNNVFINGEKLKDIKKKGGCYYRITEDGEKIRKSDIDERKVECSECGRKNELSQLVPERHFYKNYLCQSCNKRGEKNPFYNKTHSEETKKKIVENRDKDYSGENNPMYGKNVYNILVKKHGQEKADDLWDKKNEENSKNKTGKKNPFYGKTHDEDAIKKIIEANKKYWRNLSLDEHLDRNDITLKDLKNALKFYKSKRGTTNSTEEKFGLDFRTIQKYWLKSGLLDEDELKEVKDNKRFNSNPSSKEEEFYDILVDNFGDETVSRQFKINGFSYDFLIGESLIVEYDGYYWHEIVDNNNDDKKDNIAKKNGFIIYRVKENEERNVNINEEIKKIKEIYGTKTNKS